VFVASLERGRPRGLIPLTRTRCILFTFSPHRLHNISTERSVLLGKVFSIYDKVTRTTLLSGPIRPRLVIEGQCRLCSTFGRGGGSYVRHYVTVFTDSHPLTTKVLGFRRISQVVLAVTGRSELRTLQWSPPPGQRRAWAQCPIYTS